MTLWLDVALTFGDAQKDYVEAVYRLSTIYWFTGPVPNPL